MVCLHDLKRDIRDFNIERDWDQYHNPKDLIIALMGEVGELAECYQWLSADEISNVHLDPLKKEKIEEEIADIFIYLIVLCYKTDIDLHEVIAKKMEKNRAKYPADKVKGVHSNFLEGCKNQI